MSQDSTTWILTEPVEVTLISHDPDAITTTCLVARTRAPGAVVLTFGDGALLANGQPVSADAEQAYCTLADAVVLTPEFPAAGASRVVTYAGLDDDDDGLVQLTDWAEEDEATARAMYADDSE